MQYISNGIIYILMMCMMLGCIGAVRNPSRGIGYEFCEGVRQLGVVFIPIAGVMAALPYINILIEKSFIHIAEVMGHDTAIWAGMLLPPDMGGNILAHSIASAPETWMIALFISFILGANMTFGIPLSFAMVDERDYKYMSLGILCGLMACPAGITVSCVLCMYTHPLIRGGVSTTMAAAEQLSLTWLGNRLGVSSIGCLGIVASAVTLVAMFRNYAKMPPMDKVRGTAWALCGGYILADHLVYCYNFQPMIYGCLLVGKITGGVLAMILVSAAAGKTVRKMEEDDRRTGVIGEEEYLEYEREVVNASAGKRK